MDLANPHINECKDGSITIEWFFDTSRFGMSLEPNGEQSWYIITEDPLSDWYECGYLPKEMKVEVTL